MKNDVFFNITAPPSTNGQVSTCSVSPFLLFPYIPIPDPDQKYSDSKVVNKADKVRLVVLLHEGEMTYAVTCGSFLEWHVALVDKSDIDSKVVRLGPDNFVKI